MATSIEERIVAMAFENQVFEQRIAQTLTSLGKLDSAVKNISGTQGLDNLEKAGNKVTLKGPLSALDKLREKLGRSGQGADQGLGEIERAGNKVTLEGPNKALDKTQAKMDQLSAGRTFADIERASQQVELSGVTKAIDSVSSKFGMLETAASVAMGNITAVAVQKGAGFAKSFALGPVTQGLEEYQTNMNSIQTIMANTEGQQVSGLAAVNEHLDELNTYADQTKYSFSEMAKNIGTFTAAGVDLPKATASIKGIANLAAISGSNSQQASTAMYQLSQSIAAGKVGLQDWNSVVNAGMGGAIFQKSLMRTAENMGTVEKGAVKIDKATGKATVNGESFRNSIMAAPGKESWLTSDVLTNTLEQLTGDMTQAELVAKGYSEEQAKAIMKQAETAKRAATEVKTLPEVWDVARESIGSGWAKTFQLIFGDFEESKKLFTDFSNFLNGWIGKVSAARNEVLAGWKLGGGRKELIEGLKQMFTDVVLLLKPIKAAFREIFPAKTSKDLIEMTKSFHELMVNLRPSPEVIGTIHSAFKAFFAISEIGWNIIKGLGGVIADLLGVVGKGQGGFANFVGGISHFIVGVNEALVAGGGLEKFFDGLSSILQKPVELLRRLAGYFSDLFATKDNMKLTERNHELIMFGKVLTPAERLVEKLKDAWNKLVDGFDRAKGALEPWFSLFVEKISGLGEMIGNALSNLKFDDVMKGVQTGLLAGLLLMVRDLFGKGGGLMTELTEVMGGVKELLGGVTGSLDNMQKKVQAQLILAIAAAVVALAGGVYILSTIDGDKLAKAMTAVAVGLGELMGALKLMSAGLGKFGILSLPFIAAGLIGVAIAVTVLAGAMKIMGSLSWAEIGKGLSGIAGSLGVIAGAMRLMPKGLAVQGAALILLGIGLNAIAAAVKVMGGMKWEDLGKGLYGVITVLGTLALTMGMMPPNMLVNAAAIVVLSFALLTLSGAIKAMGSMDLGTLVKGIGGVTVALAALGVAMIPWFIIAPSLIPASVGLFIVANALVVLGKAMEIIGGIKILDLVKGLAAIGVALVELAVGMYLMIGTLPGAVAMMAAATALAVLAPVMAVLGSMSWGAIFKGLAAIALVLGTIAIVGVVAAPALAALGIALIPLGLGFMLVAGAAKIFASAMALLSESGQKGVAAFMVALTAFIALIPGLVISFIKGLLSIVEEVAKIAPKVVEAIGKILEMVIKFVQENAVKLAMAIGLLVDGIVLVLVENIPKLVSAGFKLLQGLLDGISQNIGEITTKVSDIIVKFLDALRGKTPRLIDAGAKLLRTFLDGVGSKFGEIATSVGNLIAKFGAAVGSQAHKIVTAAANMMGSFIGALATYGPTLVLKGAQIISDFLEGLGNKGPELIKKGVATASKFIRGISDGLVDMVNVGFDAIIDFLNGIAQAIRDNDTELMDAGANILDALVDGAVEAAGRAGGVIKRAITGLFGMLPGWAKKILGIKSPSKVFHEIGMYTMAGFQQGITDGTIKTKYVMVEVGKQSAKGMAKGLKEHETEPADAAVGMGSLMVSRLHSLLGIRSPSEVFRDIGMNVNRGFRDGLMGSREDVLSAFEDMNSSLIEKIRDLRTQVADGNTRLEDLQKQHAEKLSEIAKARSEKKPDQEAIADMVKESQDLEKQIGEEATAVNQNGKALTRAREIRKSLTGSMKDEKTQLLGLKTEYDAVSKALEEATKTLEDAINARDEAQKKYTEQYNQKPDVNSLVDAAIADADLTYAEREEKRKKAADEAEKRRKIDQVALYKQALQEQLVATQKYQATLQKLRALGLDDETYKRLLDQGTSGQEFASQLLAGGKSGIDQINAMNAQMLAASTELAKQAAANLYQQGVDAATEVIKGTADGLKKGLEQRKAEIEATMESLADMMVKAIKSKLKIKSPSQIFAELGKLTTQGLAQGLRDTAEVEGAVINLGRTMTDKLAAAVGDNDMSPVITPVLDLTQFNRDASGMGIDNVVPITAAASYGIGTATAQEVSDAQKAAADAAAEAKQPSVSFEQNNYSPEALSDVEIYRKTRNQIGQLKSVLGVPA